MKKLTHVGLDVHKESTAVAILQPDEVEPLQQVIPTTPEAFRKLFVHIGPKKLVACYEAGPCGFAPYRILNELGVACDVIAPSLIPKRPGHQVKTDRLDARNLARLHRAGQLSAIRVPTPEQEAIRDLIRVREQIKDDQRRAIQRIKSFLLRHGKSTPVVKGFSQTNQEWASTLKFDHPETQLAFSHLLATFQTRECQLVSLNEQLETAASHPDLAETVSKLRCFRGIDTLSALTIAAEVSDFRQFKDAPSFMSFTGLVPSEHSSGQRTNRGSITKTGNSHVRRVLVESAWSYRHRPAIGIKLRRRQVGQPPEVIAHCWVAQTRLHRKFVKLSATKNRNIAVTAVGRELAGFVWACMNQRYAT